MKIKLFNQGFTLIEIAVAVSIMLFLVGGGIASYVTFNDRQLLINEAKELQTYIRSAQTKARVGDRPEGCQRLEAYSVQMLGGSNLVEISAVCDDNGAEVLVLRQTAELNSTVTADQPFDIRFKVLHGGVIQPTSITLNSSGDRSYVFDVTAGGEVTGGELIDDSLEILASPSTGASPSTQASATPSGSAEASATPSTTPSALPAGVILLQNTSTSCSQQCVNQGYQNCVSVGTDAEGANGRVQSGVTFQNVYQYCFESAATCASTLSAKNITCSGKSADWIYCKCGE